MSQYSRVADLIETIHDLLDDIENWMEPWPQIRSMILSRMSRREKPRMEFVYADEMEYILLERNAAGDWRVERGRWCCS